MSILRGLLGLGKAAAGRDKAANFRERLEICRGCEHSQPCPGKSGPCRCALCGCYLPAKTRISSEGCPAYHW